MLRSPDHGRADDAAFRPSSFATTRMIRMAPRPSKHGARRGEPVPDSTTLVVRGDLLDPDVLREDASDNFELYR